MMGPILVVEPDDGTRALYRDALQLVGCEVIEASDGRDALVQALTHTPALVLTEAWLPMFDGYALSELLRRDSTTRDVPIVMLTSETGAADLERARAAGATVTLVTPTPLDAVLNEVRRLLTASAGQTVASATTVTEPPQQLARSKAHRGATLAKARLNRKTPPATPVQPPDLFCPSCGRPLDYQRSSSRGRQRS